MSNKNKYIIELEPGEEAISLYKTVINYDLFDLKDFNSRYDEVHKLVFEKSICQIQERLINVDLSCVELVKYYIFRMKQYDDYNVMISVNPSILQEAKELDEKIKSNKAGELFGAVVMLKDNIAFQPLPNTAGAYALRNSRTKRDAFIVQQLIKEDALIIGKSNLAEWANCLSMPFLDGFSTLGGHSKNPYGVFDVGSSSSGSAIGVSLNLSTIAIGTETCGSLIAPAGQNSTVSIKPTKGLISRDLIIPITDVQDTAGPIGKSVDDVYKVFRVMVGTDAKDDSTIAAHKLELKEKLDNPEAKRIGVYHSIGEDMSELINDFERLGVEVVSIDFDHVDFNNLDLQPVTEYGIIHDVGKYLSNKDVITNFKSLEEIIDFNKLHNCIPYGQKLFLDALAAKRKSNKEQAFTNQKIGSHAIDYLLDEYNLDMILSVNSHLAVLYATAGYPAITVPAGYKESGEPFAMTLVGSYMSDIKLFELAKLYEETYNHRRTPEI